MNAQVKTLNVSRRAVLKGGAITVGFALAGIPSRVRTQTTAVAKRVLDSKEVDAFLSVNGDGTVTLFCGKVDLGQGLRIAMPQIAAEELGIDVDKITFIEGDTALTPDQAARPVQTGFRSGACRSGRRQQPPARRSSNSPRNDSTPKPKISKRPAAWCGRNPAAPACHLPS